MKALAAIACWGICLAGVLPPAALRAAEQVVFELSPQVLVAGAPRIGVNLGLWTSWGAEQLASNVLKNPGFEGVIDRALVIAGEAAEDEFADDADWLARPDGFWNGALGNVRTGRAAGHQFLVLASRRRGLGGLPSFSAPRSQVSRGDAVSLTRLEDDELPTQWWFPNASAGRVTVSPTDLRPGSPGMRSLQMATPDGSPTEAISYLDAIGERAGALLPLTGQWRLSFWCRRYFGEATVSVEFRRAGAAPAFSREFAPALPWTREECTFTVPEDSGAAIVQLRFRVQAPRHAAVLLDDVELRRVTDRGPFRREVVETLRRLRPGYLRDWEGQLGDTLENRLAPEFARRASRYRPGGPEQTDFAYSLPDFLQLCLEVGANPWIVVPPTFTDEECVQLGRFLAADPRFRRFAEILVEFGNENWNGIFRPAGIPLPALHGEAADRCFRKIRQGAAGLPSLRTVVNAQHANPGMVREFARSATQSGIVAVAPYFLPGMRRGLPLADRLAGLFAGDGGRLAEEAAGSSAAGKELAVYEVNLHTTGGDAPQAERDPVTAGAAAGSALAATLLDALAHGARRQCVYALAGYDTRLAETGGFVKLWGIARDLGPTCRLRPTGLAVEMLNQALPGDLCKLTGRGAEGVRAWAFRSPQGWSVALVSTVPSPRDVLLRFPAQAGGLPGQVLRLAAPAPDATNEAALQVRVDPQPIASKAGALHLQLPGWGLAVLTAPGRRP